MDKYYSCEGKNRYTFLIVDPFIVNSLINKLVFHHPGIFRATKDNQINKELVLDQLSLSIEGKLVDGVVHGDVDLFQEGLLLVTFTFEKGKPVSITMKTDFSGIYDLSYGGKRVEGSKIVENEITYYVGNFYNEEDRLEYQGIMVNNKRIGFGISHFPDLERPSYIGFYRNDIPHGIGIFYDRNGEGLCSLVKNGVAACSKLVVNETQHLTDITSVVISVDFYPGCLYENIDICKQLQKAPDLITLCIHDYCLNDLSNLSITGLNALTTIEIGNNAMVDDIEKRDDYWNPIHNTLSFYRLPSLKIIKIGKRSCNNVQKLRIEECDHLERIEIGGKCTNETEMIGSFAWCRAFIVMSRKTK